MPGFSSAQPLLRALCGFSATLVDTVHASTSQPKTSTAFRPVAAHPDTEIEPPKKKPSKRGNFWEK